MKYYLNESVNYYICSTDQAFIIVFGDGDTRFCADAPYIDDGEYKEIHAPDTDLIEEFFINATDRPSVQGFKYPKLHEYLLSEGEDEALWDALSASTNLIHDGGIE